MATVFEGERLLKVLKVSGSTAGTHYTVPTGRFAKVVVQSVSHPGGGSATVSFGSSSLTTSIAYSYPSFSHGGTTVASGDTFLSAEKILDQGETIATTSTASVDVTVLEFERKNS